MTKNLYFKDYFDERKQKDISRNVHSSLNKFVSMYFKSLLKAKHILKYKDMDYVN